jgi:1,4-dihydroxy-2-naphthoate octaprenyltransferase
VRLGYAHATRLYQAIIVLLALVTLALGAAGLLAHAVIPLVSLLFLLRPLRLLQRAPAERMELTPATGQGFFAYGLCLLLAVWWSL